MRERKSDQVWLAKKRKVKKRDDVTDFAQDAQGAPVSCLGCSACSGELTELRVISAYARAASLLTSWEAEKRENWSTIRRDHRQHDFMHPTRASRQRRLLPLDFLIPASPRMLEPNLLSPLSALATEIVTAAKTLAAKIGNWIMLKNRRTRQFFGRE